MGAMGEDIKQHESDTTAEKIKEENNRVRRRKKKKKKREFWGIPYNIRIQQLCSQKWRAKMNLFFFKKKGGGDTNQHTTKSKRAISIKRECSHGQVTEVSITKER